MPRKFLPLFALLLPPLLSLPALGSESPAVMVRRPVALALSADENSLLVANRDSGSICLLTAEDGKLLAEYRIGQSLSSIARLDERHFLATDETAHQLLLLELAGAELTVLQRLPISPFPKHVVVQSDGRRTFVSSKWSQRATIVEITSGEGGRLQLAVAKTIDLPFAGGRQLLVESENRLILADFFRGRLAIIDTDRGELAAVRKFFAHNIRGLGIDPHSKLLAVSHSMLNEYATTVQNDVHWGVLMSNDLRWLQVDHVLDPDADFYNRGHIHPLGEPGMGGSDPGELAFLDDGTVVVPMGGMNKVAFGKEGDFGLHRIDVGRRPTTVAVSNKHRLAYVANTLDDTISIINLATKKKAADVSLGESPELSLAQRGEQLFYSGRLSHDGWMTCHSCHTDGHATGDLNDNFSDKSFGASKRVLSLLGAKDTAPYAWNGQVEKLESQIRSSLQHTMQSKRFSDDDIAALAAFVSTLEPPPAVDALRGTRDQPAIARGEKLFTTIGCNHCHAPPLYTSAKAYDVGLHDKEGNTHFNPPSLRGAGQRSPFFHDASAETLEDVFSTHGHQLKGRVLSDDELRDLVAFLRSL